MKCSDRFMSVQSRVGAIAFERTSAAPSATTVATVSELYLASKIVISLKNQYFRYIVHDELVSAATYSFYLKIFALLYVGLPPYDKAVRQLLCLLHTPVLPA